MAPTHSDWHPDRWGDLDVVRCPHCGAQENLVPVPPLKGAYGLKGLERNGDTVTVACSCGSSYEIMLSLSPAYASRPLAGALAAAVAAGPLPKKDGLIPWIKLRVLVKREPWEAGISRYKQVESLFDLISALERFRANPMNIDILALHVTSFECSVMPDDVDWTGFVPVPV